MKIEDLDKILTTTSNWLWLFEVFICLTFIPVICFSIFATNNKLDKLIKLNTPEYVNVVPEIVITEKR